MLKLRFRRNTIISRGMGPDSPMERVEKLILSAILQRAAMHQPLNVTECIHLLNSLIDKSVIQKELVEWKIHVFGNNFCEEGSDCVGKK
jgi:hypothetical protein